MSEAGDLNAASVFGRLADALEDDWLNFARPNQLLPAGDWSIWLILAGRGWGKTRTGAETIRGWVDGGCRRIALVAATASDAREVMVEGESGILAISPKWNRPEYEPSKRRLTWPNGAIATTYSAEEAERLRGPQHDAAWCDELGAWKNREATWDQLLFGLRLGARPRAIVTTTPKPLKLIKELVARDGKDVVVTRGSTRENEKNLAPTFLNTIVGRYAGTRLGRQELEAEILEDADGALWTRETIEDGRVEKAPLDMKRIVIAIDPATSSGEKADETGIVAAGVGIDGHGYVLEDASGRYAPTEWAKKAISMYRRWRADRVVAEVNQGGAMVESTLRVVDPNVSYKAVHATRGKIVRAEPVAALYDQHRVHHVGAFPQLEDQCCTYTAGSSDSPDRLDALVWAFTDLMVDIGRNDGIIEFYRRQAEEGEPLRLAAPASPMVRMLAPEGSSHLSTLTGRLIEIPADRIVELSVEDAAPMTAAGWLTLDHQHDATAGADA